MKFVDRLVNYMNENDIKQIDIIKNSNNEITKGYLSMVVNGKREPNKKLLEVLSNMSNKSMNWWMNGKEEYDSLDSLNSLINYFIKDGSIRADGSMEEETRQIIHTMLEKEIRVKLEKAQH